jgi:hypothetical protein
MSGRRSGSNGGFRHQTGAVELGWARTPIGVAHAVDPHAVRPEAYSGHPVPSLCDPQAQVHLASGTWPPRPSDTYELCERCAALLSEARSA